MQNLLRPTLCGLASKRAVWYHFFFLKKAVTFSCDPGQIVDETECGFITFSLCMLPSSCMHVTNT